MESLRCPGTAQGWFSTGDEGTGDDAQVGARLTATVL